MVGADGFRRYHNPGVHGQPRIYRAAPVTSVAARADHAARTRNATGGNDPATAEHSTLAAAASGKRKATCGKATCSGASPGAAIQSSDPTSATHPTEATQAADPAGAKGASAAAIYPVFSRSKSNVESIASVDRSAQSARTAGNVRTLVGINRTA
jgi:hypothetical protein